SPLLSTTFPRPSYLTVAPGETQWILVSTLTSELDSATWKPGGSFDQPIAIDVFDAPNGTRLDELVLHDQVRLLAPLDGHAHPGSAPNATVTGRILNAKGRPLAGVDVQVSSADGFVSSAHVRTNAKGVYSDRIWTGARA